MFQKLNLVVLCIFMSACIQIRDPEKKTPASQNSPGPVQNLSLEVQKLSYEIQPLSQPQHYLVRFFGVAADEKFILQRQPVGAQEKPVLIENLEDLLIAPGQYQYRLQQGHHEETVSVTIPQDLVLTGAINLTQLPLVDVKDSSDYTKKLSLTDGRLFLRANTVLTTGGARVLIEADAIESEGAILQTFTPNFRVPNGNAPSGGLIHLKTRSMRGSLHVTMRGLDGPSALIWPLPGKIMQRDGFHGGNSGLLIVEIQDMARASITYDIVAGKGGQGAEVKNQPRGKPGHDGILQPPCLLRNNKCEELKAYN